MYRNHKIVILVPSGRERYLRILSRYLNKLTHIVDTCYLLWNAKNSSDQEYIKELEQSYPSFYKIIESGCGNSLEENNAWGQATNVRNFYKYFDEPGTLYIKIDDDIVFIETNNFEKYLDFKIDHPEYFIVFPLIVNSPATCFFLQKSGIIPMTNPPIGTYHLGMEYPDFYRGGVHTLDPIAHGFPPFAAALHDQFINDYDTQWGKWRIGKWVLKNYENVNINFCMWSGDDMRRFDKMFADNDENDFTYCKPQIIQKFCAVTSDMIVSHYAFWSQAQFLDQCGYVNRFEILADKYLKDKI
jgi:hypothetical protein